MYGKLSSFSAIFVVKDDSSDLLQSENNTPIFALVSTIVTLLIVTFRAYSPLSDYAYMKVWLYVLLIIVSDIEQHLCSR